jgi:hypothetical protein
VEVRALVELSPDMRPMLVTHARLAMTWQVLRVLEARTRPRDEAGTTELQRFCCRVRGPLPGRPSELGVFEMSVRRYAGRPGWWIGPESDAD